MAEAQNGDAISKANDLLNRLHWTRSIHSTQIPQPPLTSPRTPTNTNKNPWISSIMIYGVILVISALILVTPVLVGYGLHWKIDIAQYAFSVYALISLIYLLVQCILALLNRIKIWYRRSRNLDVIEIAPNEIGVLVVGYREDPEYFRKCLQSIRKQTTFERIRVVAVIDGDEGEDEYMALEMARELDAVLIKPGFILSEMPNDDFLAVLEASIPHERSKVVCIMQPHGGKRAAMYTGLRLLRNCTGIAVTDSDTILGENAAEELYRALMTTNGDRVGAVTGNVSLFNTSTPLTYISSLRYWFAFNLERAADSALGSVMCISGPLGIYRSAAIQDNLRAWKHQRFLNKECTYGDDRHLTNIVLNSGYETAYTHLALCETESPSTLSRWISQQSRWTKSFYREILFYNPQSFNWRCLWVYFSMGFHAFFPIMSIYGVIFVLYLSHHSLSRIEPIAIWTITILAVAIVKSLFGVVVGRDFRLLLIPLYSVLYILILLPVKVGSLLAINDPSWLTSPRLTSNSAAKKRCQLDVLPVTIGIWLVVLIGGLTFGLTR
eukprot:Partr_v1_DN27465_c0_g1_i1_m72102 putative chitin synthase